MCCMVCNVGFWVMLSECDVLLPVCCWSPATANKDVCSQLSEAQQAALKKAVEMGQQFAVNPTSPVIWEHLTSLLEQVKAAVCGWLHSC